MRSFGSDNNSGVHPRIMQAIAEANTDHTVAYGDDAWSAACRRGGQGVVGRKRATTDVRF